jgi:hypothetical protein
MTEYDTTQGATGPQAGPGAATLGVDLIDVLIRNLELAKANFEGGAQNDGGELMAAEGTVFCTLLYAVPGQICPLLYYHSLTDAETEPAV